MCFKKRLEIKVNISIKVRKIDIITEFSNKNSIINIIIIMLPCQTTFMTDDWDRPKTHSTDENQSLHCFM